MKIALVNVDFKDAYTGKLHKAGSKAKFTEERVKEIKAVNSEFISVIGEEPDATSKENPKE